MKGLGADGSNQMGQNHMVSARQPCPLTEQGLSETVRVEPVSEMPTTLTPHFFPVPAANSRGPAPLTGRLSEPLVVLSYVDMEELVAIKAVAALARRRWSRV